MNSVLTLKYSNLVSMVARLKLANDEYSINSISSEISKTYKELLQVNNQECKQQLLQLRPAIIEIYQFKQNQLKELTNKQKQINIDINQNVNGIDEEIRNFFNKNSFHIVKTESNSKVFSLEEIKQQVNDISSSTMFLTSDGYINSVTQKLLLQRIYNLSQAQPETDRSEILKLLNLVTKQHQEPVSTETTPDTTTPNLVDTDTQKLEQQVTSLLQ